MEHNIEKEGSEIKGDENKEVITGMKEKQENNGEQAKKEEK